jgi:threonine dehydrogenase-like Zn-dependent dehydrogenase
VAAIAYPVNNLGYGEVGEVLELGSAAPGSLAIGDQVWGTWGHRSSAVIDGAAAASRRIHTDDPRTGVFAHIGAVGLGAVLDADLHVGETIAVFGLGVPGQIAAQLARRNGARVIAIDGIPSRRELALQLGADVALDPSESPAERIRELTDGRGADAVIEITGNYRALQESIRSVAYNSRVIVAGFFQGEASGLRLGEEFHHNRVQLIASQVGGVPGSLGHRWDRPRLWRTVVDLATGGELEVLPLISHELPLREVATAFALLDEHPDQALQVLLDVRGES